ncbi:MAG: CYTH domain-containing protein [Candidatus Peribacteria bacterium]|nr:MAG: CYTH domain-containing protein [Candidatus Peribacteria bacterium]
MIEIEKKYELSEHDMQIIESTCTLIQESEIKDYYLDTDEYTLFKHQYFLRLRNGRYELKIIDPYDGYGVARAQEIIDEDEINTHLKIFHITIDDTAGKVYIETKRKNFQYEFEGQNFSIDVDMYQYDKRYEIELTMEDDTGIDGEKLIE